MVGHGTRHFAFLHLSSADKPQDSKLITDTTEAYVSVQVIRDDITRTSNVKKTIQAMTAEGKRVAGVVHDRVIANITPSKWNATLALKVMGALELSDELRTTGIDDQLDFVLTSSVVSNYLAANAFLANLA